MPDCRYWSLVLGIYLERLCSWIIQTPERWPATPKSHVYAVQHVVSRIREYFGFRGMLLPNPLENGVGPLLTDIRD